MSSGISLTLAGKSYGFWTVIGYSETRRHGERFLECRCTCGTVRNISGSALKGGKSKSCGCANRREGQERAAEEKGIDPLWTHERREFALFHHDAGLSLAKIAQAMVLKYGHVYSDNSVLDALRYYRSAINVGAVSRLAGIDLTIPEPEPKPAIPNYHTENIHFRRAPIWTPPASIVARSMIGCSAAMAADAGSMP